LLIVGCLRDFLLETEDGGSTLLRNLVSIYQTTWRHIPKDSTLHLRDNLKPNRICKVTTLSVVLSGRENWRLVWGKITNYICLQQILRPHTDPKRIRQIHCFGEVWALFQVRFWAGCYILSDPFALASNSHRARCVFQTICVLFSLQAWSFVWEDSSKPSLLLEPCFIRCSDFIRLWCVHKFSLVLSVCVFKVSLIFPYMKRCLSICYRYPVSMGHFVIAAFDRTDYIFLRILEHVADITKVLGLLRLSYGTC
jgi:hypothetical protein